MKSYLLPAFLWVVLFSASSSLGQIRDDKDSYSLLAAQCFISAKKAGRTDVSLAGYDQYATSLAKTISYLSAEQQDRVFNPATGGRAAGLSSSSESAERGQDTAPGDTSAAGTLIEPMNRDASGAAVSGMFSDMGDEIINGANRVNSLIAGVDETPEPLLGVTIDPEISADESAAGDSVFVASADVSAPLVVYAAASAEAAPVYAARSASSTPLAETASDSVNAADAIPASDAAGAAAATVDDEIGDVLAVRSDQERAAIDNTFETGSAGVLNEASNLSSFDFWEALKGFLVGVFDYFNGDSGRQYEEYAGN